MSETIVSKYIEGKWEKDCKSRFVANFEWLKQYLEETVPNEFDLVDLFFSTDSSITSKTHCAARMSQILLKLMENAESILLSEILIENGNDSKDSHLDDDDHEHLKTLICSTLDRFLIQDITTMVINYSHSTYFQVGMYIDTMDAAGTWDIGEIKQIFRYKSNTYLLIHYLEWSNTVFDEVINANSKRLLFLYDDENQIVYNWTKVDRNQEVPVDCRLRGETKWQSCESAFDFKDSPAVLTLAPAGTFIK